MFTALLIIGDLFDAINDVGDSIVDFASSLDPSPPTYFITGSRDGLSGYSGWDAEVSFVCGSSDQVVTWINSYHDNGKEDRRWRFACSDISPPQGSISSQNCGWEGWINDWDDPIDYNCPGNKFLRGFNSIHDNGKEDRLWKVYCCDMKWSVTNEVLRRSSPILESPVNDWDGELDFQAPNGYFLSGMWGIHDNGKEDRLFGFYLSYITSELTFDYPFVGTSFYNANNQHSWDLKGLFRVVNDRIDTGSYVEFYLPNGGSFTTRIGVTGTWNPGEIEVVSDPGDPSGFSFTYSGNGVTNYQSSTVQLRTIIEHGRLVSNNDAWSWSLNFAVAACPSNPSGGVPTGACSPGLSCDFGTETCCGESFPSLHCECSGFGEWMCFFTEACYGRICEEWMCSSLSIANAQQTECLMDGVHEVSCSVTCNPGYELLAGNQPSVSCNFGQWSDHPTCREIPCGVPSVGNSNAANVCGTMSPGNSCQVTCNNGYRISSGVSQIQCSLGPVFSTMPQCELTPCASLNLDHRYTGSNNCGTSAVGSTCSITCADGYQIIDQSSTIECQFGGVWTTIPTCQEIPCEIPDISNSNSGENCGIMSPGDSCNVQCLDGYQLVSNSNLECLLGPSFTSLPECVQIPCPSLSIDNSRSSVNCGTAVDDECIIVCNAGYELQGDPLVHCEFGGTWSQLPFCERTICPALMIDDSTSSSDCSEILSGENCYFSCLETYEKNIWNEIDAGCGLDGEWRVYAECVEIYCPSVDISFSNSVTECNETRANDICSFACNDDYEIRDESDAVISCDVNGRWQGEFPQCEEIIKCDVPWIDHSNAVSECGNTIHDTLCEFTCEENFEIFDDPIVDDGDRTIYCNEFGEWEYLPKECKLVLVKGRFPEEVIEEEDIEEQIQTNSAVETAVDNLIKGMLFDNVPFEDVIMNHGAIDDPYTWFTDENGQYDDAALSQKMSRLDLQPHAGEKSFYDNYNHMIYNGLQMKTLTPEEELELDALEVAIDELNQKFNNDTNEIFFACFDAEKTNEEIETCFQLNGLNEIERQYNENVERVSDERSEILYDVVQELRAKSDDDMIGDYHDWCTKPTPNEVVEIFSEPSETQVSELSISERTVDNEVTVEDVFRPMFAAYRGGQFVTVKMKETSLNAEIKMEFNKWSRVNISPGLWYDNSWINATLDTRHLHEGYTIDNEMEPEKISVWGPEGVINSVPAQFIVAQDVKIEAKGNSSLVQQLRVLYEDAESVKLGNFCSGKACATDVNVILDTYTAFPSTIEFTKAYFSATINQVRRATYRKLSRNNTIAILGSEPSINNDIAGILYQMKSQLQIDEFYFYDGVTEMRNFFSELSSGEIDPQIIWFSATDNINDINEEESEVLRENAIALDEYVTSGGGLIAHGYPNLAFKWIKELLPEFESILGACDSSNIEISHAGRALLSSEFTTELLISMPCAATFSGENLGNLEALVSDASSEFFVLGAFGGISEGSSPLLGQDSGGSQVYFQDYSSVEELRFELNFVFDHPVILATYAPRFPVFIPHSGCNEIEHDSL